MMFTTVRKTTVSHDAGVDDEGKYHVNENSKNIRLIQIGANDGSVDGNDDLIRKLLENPRTHAILVEGNPKIFPALTDTIKKHYHNSSRITAVNSLICEDGERMPFYIVNETAILQEFGRAPHWVLYQLSSLSKDSILAGLGFFLRKRKPKHPLEAYISSIVIECASVASIISDRGWNQRDDVDVLAVDVEGFDTKVVSRALDDKMLPSLIVFEQKGAARLFPGELEALLHRLEDLGYTHDFCGKKPGCRQADDVVAIRGTNEKLFKLLPKGLPLPKRG